MTHSHVPASTSSTDPKTINLEPFRWKNWNILPLQETTSTNEVARNHPAWTAVVADYQTSGRGRHGRRWTSNRGGLWLSAVLPTPGDPAHWKPLPLAIGLAVIRTLNKLSVNARMRWPNDIMVENLKLAGLLLERFCPEHIIVGIGVNLTNSPDHEDPELKKIAIRLCDLTPSLPSRDEFMTLLLSHIQEIHQEMLDGGVEALSTELNSMWGPLPRPVEICIKEKKRMGDFWGITPAGNLVLKDTEGAESIYESAHVTMLRELV